MRKKSIWQNAYEPCKAFAVAFNIRQWFSTFLIKWNPKEYPSGSRNHCLHTGSPQNQGIQGESGNFIFNQRKSWKIEIEIREVIELLWFHFRDVTFSILSHTSSWMWQLVYIILFCAVILRCSTFDRTYVILWNQKFELQKQGQSPPRPHLSKEMRRILGGNHG